MYVCVYMVSLRSEGIGSPGTGVIDGLEPLGTELGAVVRPRSALKH